VVENLHSFVGDVVHSFYFWQNIESRTSPGLRECSNPVGGDIPGPSGYLLAAGKEQKKHKHIPLPDIFCYTAFIQKGEAP